MLQFIIHTQSKICFFQNQYLGSLGGSEPPEGGFMKLHKCVPP